LIYLGFVTEGKLAAVLITPSLGIPNWPIIYIMNTAPPPAKLHPMMRCEGSYRTPEPTSFGLPSYAIA
jgi:hypothetical protein